jgi:uncharacterized protein
MVKSPKLYIRDSGLVHALLGVASSDDVLAHPVVGNSWEGFVIEALLNAAPVNTSAGFYRTSNGAEGKNRPFLEVKSAFSPMDICASSY